MTIEEFMDEHGSDYYTDSKGVMRAIPITYGMCESCEELIVEGEAFGCFHGRVFHRSCLEDFAMYALTEEELFDALNTGD